MITLYVVCMYVVSWESGGTLNYENTDKVINSIWRIEKAYLNWGFIQKSLKNWVFIQVRWIIFNDIINNLQISVASSTTGSSHSDSG